MSRDRNGNGRFVKGNQHRFKRGESGNPSGRPRGARYVGDYLRSMGDLTERELRAIEADHQQPQARRTAARLFIDATHPDPHVRFRAMTTLMDRTDGKPAMAATIHDERPTATPAEVRARLVAKLGGIGAPAQAGAAGAE